MTANRTSWIAPGRQSLSMRGFPVSRAAEKWTRIGPLRVRPSGLTTPACPDAVASCAGYEA
jgi:hypothetical protein